MTDFTKIPTIRLSKEDQERLYQVTIDDIIGSGRLARKLGHPLTDCPPFVDESMAVSWRMGWWQQERAIKHSKGKIP